jgi:hypothetical protein
MSPNPATVVVSPALQYGEMLYHEVPGPDFTFKVKLGYKKTDGTIIWYNAPNAGQDGYTQNTVASQVTYPTQLIKVTTDHRVVNTEVKSPRETYDNSRRSDNPGYLGR